MTATSNYLLLSFGLGKLPLFSEANEPFSTYSYFAGIELLSSVYRPRLPLFGVQRRFLWLREICSISLLVELQRYSFLIFNLI